MAWADDYERLAGCDPSSLSPDELDTLADAAFWQCLEAEAIAARQRAYAGYLQAGADHRAARAAWWLFYAYISQGESAVAMGWLRRARRHLEPHPEGVEHGYLSFGEAEAALARGESAEAERLAGRALELGERLDDPNLVAMGLQLSGRALIEQAQVDRGLVLLDEAMCLVLAGQLTDLLTGIVYCQLISVCRDLADLGRAWEWTVAARAWCESLSSVSLFHGLCRVYRGEVLALRGLWDDAETELRGACGDLLDPMPGAAGAAFYAVGDIHRRRGDLPAAEAAYARAHELGRDLQPGLSLLRLAQGRADAASAAVGAALAAASGDRVGRARLLAAQVEVALVRSDVETARGAVEDLAAVADDLGSVAVRAQAAAARGAVRLADGDAVRALPDLRSALGTWRDLGLPYEEAQARLLVGRAIGALGDEEGARLEIEAARAAFERLGAHADARRAGDHLPLGPGVPGGLTARELEVLRLVAAGKSNREIGSALVISEHTVARHLQNIYAKLSLSSRTAASAFAFEHHLV